jgi:UDP-N-acetylmuramyl pentapeptide phosphotransferase/UDP-N-acetylglucosamine-1-phosphate transferase
LPFIAAGSLLIFFIGLKDDVFILDPKKKFITQFVAAILVVLFTDIRITSLYGVFGIGEINYVFSFMLSVFILVAVTNAYNLIDGIDGLAASTGIIASISFGTWFYLAGLTSYAVLCFALAGALIAFMRFNLCNGRKKIFMGDAGSLNTGFILGIAAIVFIQTNLDKEIAYYVRSAPAVAMGFMFLPIFDTVRVMFLRIFQRKSPFEADMQHIHHMLLRLGYSHISATILLSFFSIGFVVISLLLRDIGVLWLLLILVVIAIAIYLVPFTLIVRRLKTNIKPKVENIIKKNPEKEKEIL